MSEQRITFMRNLQRIQKEDYRLREGERLQDVAALMLQYIGDPDPELRDDLIYSTFYHWIIKKKSFTEAELRSLLTVLTDDGHLFYHIGSEGDSTVFTRSFSVLPIALIVRRHRQEPFLDLAEFQHVKHSLIRYVQEEKDLRGYVNEGGWAHSAAHAADALTELVQCPECDAEGRLQVLAAVQGMLHNGSHIFNEEEDERIACIVDTIMDQELLPPQEIERWIAGLAECGSWSRARNNRFAQVNSKNLVRCLYFRRKRECRNGLAPVLVAAEVQLNWFAVTVR
ncbi:DUF2785 domain-containing protein [Paenibacillus thiaminolyticus]|nr:DUF2785 domain-containing protein [Paenibacillus thiaminolyticus]